MDETGQPGGVTPGDAGDDEDSSADHAWSGGWSAGRAAWPAPGDGPRPEAAESAWRQPAPGFATRAWSDPPARYTDVLPASSAATRHTSNGVSHDHRTGGPYSTERPHGDQRHVDHPSGDPVARRRSDRQSDEPAGGRGRAPGGQPEGDSDDVARVRPGIPAPRPASADEHPYHGPHPDPEHPQWAPPPATGADPSADPRRLAGERPAGSPSAEGSGRSGAGSAPLRPPAGEPARWRADVPREWDPAAPTAARAATTEPYGEPRRPGGQPVGAVPDESFRGSHDLPRPSTPDHDGAPAGQSDAAPGRGGPADRASNWAPPWADDRHGTGEYPSTARPARPDRSTRDPLAPGPFAADIGPPDPLAAGFAGPANDALPQRVPAEPDVPAVPEPPAVDPPAETPELARIATHLRREESSSPVGERPDGFDVNAILAAVHDVPGVRDASLRVTPSGAHSLRLDLADGADPAEVSRQVARLLQERMGLAAAPRNLPGHSATKPSFPANPARGATTRSTSAEGLAPGTVGPRRRRQLASAYLGRSTAAEPTAGPTTVAGPAAGHGGPVVPAPRLPAGGIGSAGATRGAPTGTGTAVSRPLHPGERPGPRVVIDHVQVSTFGMDATVEVRLAAGPQQATGLATGPAVDGYVLRLCAASAASAIDQLLRTTGRAPERGRCFVEHAAVVPFVNCEVAVVVVLLVCDGWVEQLAGSAVVDGDPRQAVVRATLAAVNRRLAALLS